MKIIAPDAVLVTDGGGKKIAAIRPIHTRDNIVRFLSNVSKGAVGLFAVPGEVNGEPALVVTDGSVVDTVLFVQVEDGRISRIYGVRNPDKLAAVSLPNATPIRFKGSAE
jgi:RNA polymerase sigma-70 factor (ECF subfamily)